MDQPNQCRMQKRESWQSRLAHVREAAKKDKKSKFTVGILSSSIAKLVNTKPA
jgi:hypothetical protein